MKQLHCEEVGSYSNLKSNNEKPYKLLESDWLEERVFDVLCDLKETCYLDDIGWDIKTTLGGESEFQVDVIALKGYQSFIFSCTTDSSKGLIKQKSFEVNYRSVQLGGAQAKAIMVCLGSEGTCKRVKKDMRQFDADRNFSIIDKDSVMDRESLKNKIREIIRY